MLCICRAASVQTIGRRAELVFHLAAVVLSSLKNRIHRAKQIGSAIANLPVVAAAIVWRRTALRNATVIAVTGSVGKTTTTRLLCAILSKVGPTLAPRGASNGRKGIPALLLRGRPHHRFVVVEVGILKRGRMWRSALVVKPDVTIITHVNWQHARSYESLEQIAEQKAILLNPLGKRGLAVLNADDQRVVAMAVGRDCHVRTYGLASAADVRAEDVEGSWPENLSLTILDNEDSRQFRTRLIGTHWVPSILGAVAAARALGASWDECATAISETETFPSRLSQLRLPNGAHLLRDEYNGSFATFERSLEVMEQARCDRRVLAIGHIQDTPQFGDLGPEEVGRRCAETGDLLLFWGSYKARYRDAAMDAGVASESILLFETLAEMAEGLRSLTRKGDLVLLKGTWFDHMSRVAYAQLGTVACSVEPCLLHWGCDPCPKLGFIADPAVDKSLVQPLLHGQAMSAKR